MTVFRTSYLRLLATMVGSAVLVGAVLWLVEIVVYHHRGLDDVLPAAVGFLVGVGAARWWRERRRTRVELSDYGLTWSYRGGHLVSMTWVEIASVQVRRPGVLAFLEIVPVDLRSIVAQTPAEDFPRIRTTPRGRAFQIDVGEFKPGPAALRAALDANGSRVGRGSGVPGGLA